MQPIKFLSNWIQNNANSEHYLFSLYDLRALYPDLSNEAFKALLSRAVRGMYLTRVCKGLYTHKAVIPADGLFLFHVAAYLRSDKFNYISLETVLSEVGIISQIPINWLVLMSSGRSNTICCGEFGKIEFVHTKKKPIDVIDHLSYDSNCHLWRANVTLALRDMKATHRNCDLINWDVVNEFI